MRGAPSRSQLRIIQLARRHNIAANFAVKNWPARILSSPIVPGSCASPALMQQLRVPSPAQAATIELVGDVVQWSLFALGQRTCASAACCGSALNYRLRAD